MARDRQETLRISANFFITGAIGAASDAAKLLAGHLWTGEHATVAGCFRRPTAYLAGDLGWTVKKTSAALAELVSCGFIDRDERTGWTVILAFLECNPIHNAQAGSGAVALFAEMPPRLQVTQRALEVLRPFHVRLRPAVEARKAQQAARRMAADQSAGEPKPKEA